jgi:Ketopantoate reductase PanE/ApbA C terminal
VGARRSTVDPRRETRSFDQQSVCWEKFLFITGVGGVIALACSGIGPLLASAEGQRLLTTSCAEAEAVARAEGIHLGSDAVGRIFKQAASLVPQWQSSMARDLEVGRRCEVEALSGTVVRRGRTHDIATPVHQAIWACLSAHQPSQLDGQWSIDQQTSSQNLEETSMRLVNHVAIVPGGGTASTPRSPNCWPKKGHRSRLRVVSRGRNMRRC